MLAWMRRRFPRFEIHQMPPPVSLFNLTSQLSSGVNDGKNASSLGLFFLAGSDRPGAFVWERKLKLNASLNEFTFNESFQQERSSKKKKKTHNVQFKCALVLEEELRFVPRIFAALPHEDVSVSGEHENRNA